MYHLQSLLKKMSTSGIWVNTCSVTCLAAGLTSLMFTASTKAAPSSDHLDDFWQFADIYQDEQNNYLKLSGRLQLDSAWINSDQGDFNDTLWRRFRFGFKGKQGDFTAALEADINLNNHLDDLYNRLTDANISWAATSDTNIKVLKQSAGFTLDGRTSSKKLLTAQRNNLTNNLWFTAEYFTGISLSSQATDHWSYKAGIFSSDDSDEIGFSEASYFTLLSASKKLEQNDYWHGGKITFDYVFNDTHEAGNTRQFSQVFTASGQLALNDQWQLFSDFSWGQGDLGQSDLVGIVFMPTYQQSQSLQLVTRYTYLSSTEKNGVRFGRYESSVVSDRGNQYQELYAGMNWFIHSHKLKVQTGVQYAKMLDDANDGGAYNGWGLTLALRSYW